MKLALDTNRYTDLMIGVPEVVRVLETASSIYVPFRSLAGPQACVNFLPTQTPCSKKSVSTRLIT